MSRENYLITKIASLAYLNKKYSVIIFDVSPQYNNVGLFPII